MNLLICYTSLVILVIGFTECQYQEEPWQPYSFGYAINDGYGNEQSREEKSDANGHKRGSYGYTDAYGLYRKVDYIADEHGFRASISTNEPGTGGPDPADVHMDARPVDNPPVIAAAPAYHSPQYHAPPPTYHSSAPAEYHSHAPTEYHSPAPTEYHSPDYAVYNSPDPAEYHSSAPVEDHYPAPIYSEASYNHPVPYGQRRVAIVAPAPAPAVAYSEPRGAFRRLPAPTPYLPLRYKS